jgi:co-chaperonin GroES (HSP10)
MLQALNTKLIIERRHEEQKSAMGLVLTNSANPNPRGIVLSIGEGVKDKCPNIAVGDIVVVEWTQTAKVQDGGKDVYVIDVGSIYAKE